MKSLLINRFYTTQLLNALSDELLRELFTPVAGEIEETFDELLIPSDADERRSYCGRLADLIADAEDPLGRDFLVGLERIMHLSRMGDIGDIVAAAMEHPRPGPFQVTGDPDVVELAIRLWLWNPDFVARQIAGRPPKPKSYFVYQATGTVPVFSMPDDVTRSRMEEKFADWFNTMKRGDNCNLQIREMEDEVVFVVGHGDLNRIVELLRGGVVVRDILRPYDYDLIIFRKGSGTLFLYLRRLLKRLMALYLKEIGEMVFGIENLFEEKSLNLAPLTQGDPQRFLRPAFPTIRSVRLTRIRMVNFVGSGLSGNFAENDIYRDMQNDDSFWAFISDPRRRPESAEIALEISGLDKPVTVKLAPPHKVSVSKPEYLPLIHRWLDACRFFTSQNSGDGDLENTEPLPVASVL